MYEREKLSGTNFNDWFRSLKLVLRVEKKLFVIKQPIFLAPTVGSTDQAFVYVEQLECLGYVLPQVLSAGLILNSLTSDFAGFVRNYNMHNMGKTIGELHALLIEYEKGLPKKIATPQVMAIQGVSKNNVLYFNAIPSNGIYEIDMLNLVPNVKSIYNVSNKRAKHNLDSIYLWHCRLAHISNIGQDDKETVSTSYQKGG
ncbi:hypothetical protein Tco_1548093 [Tanacetum coccineum]